MAVVEIDIAADGTIQATPNPVAVASGEHLVVHLRSNACERARRYHVRFPGGAESPFAQPGETDQTAVACQGPVSEVRWRPGVERGVVDVWFTGSPLVASTRIYVVPAITSRLAGRGVPKRVAPRPFFVQNFHFAGTGSFAGAPSNAASPIPVTLTWDTKCGERVVADWQSEVGPREVAINCRNEGDCPSVVYVYAGNTRLDGFNVGPGKSAARQIGGVTRVYVDCLEEHDQRCRGTLEIR